MKQKLEGRDEVGEERVGMAKGYRHFLYHSAHYAEHDTISLNRAVVGDDRAVIATYRKLNRA